jgi:hypothetical protein
MAGSAPLRGAASIAPGRAAIDVMERVRRR